MSLHTRASTARDKQHRLRELLAERNKIATVPGCYDALGARLVQQSGFPAAYMSGLCVAASLGHPDVGIIGMAEMAARAAVIAAAIDIPLIADADTGYGSASNIAETVRAFERAGVAGIHLEDQTNPKKCAALPGKALVPVKEMTARLEIARQARTSPDFVIIGRTDAVAVDGLDAAIDRARAYEDAGADATMIMGLSSEDDMARATAALQRPPIVLMAEKLRPLIKPDRLRDLGYPMVIYPLTTLMATIYAGRELMDCLRAQGTTEALLDRVAPLECINRLLDLDGVVDLETRYQALLELRH